jgi:hypothetical protein
MVAMTQSVVTRALVGPYGLHALGVVSLALIFAFLWLFNFTNFF